MPRRYGSLSLLVRFGTSVFVSSGQMQLEGLAISAGNSRIFLSASQLENRHAKSTAIDPPTGLKPDGGIQPTESRLPFSIFIVIYFRDRPACPVDRKDMIEPRIDAHALQGR